MKYEGVNTQTDLPKCFQKYNSRTRFNMAIEMQTRLL